MPLFRKTRSAPEMSSTEPGLWKGKKVERQGAAKKKKKMPEGWKGADWRVKGAENLAVATARLHERLSHITNWISYQVYTLTHPCSPLRRRAARRSKEQSRLAATERRIQKEHIARSKAAERRAISRETQIREDADHAKLLRNQDRSVKFLIKGYLRISGGRCSQTCNARVVFRLVN